MANDPSISLTTPSPGMEEAAHGMLFRPTDEQRRTVRMMVGFGAPYKDIATVLDIDVTVLQQHFRNELDRGAVETTVKVAQTLFHMATVGKNVAAAIFWMKARAGWSEKVGISGRDGSPVIFRVASYAGSDDAIETDGPRQPPLAIPHAG